MSTKSNQSKIKPARWYYLIGIAVLVVGPIVFGLFLFSSVSSNMSTFTKIPSLQAIVPGKTDLTFSNVGKYTIFYEYQSIVGNRVFSTGENIPGIQVNLLSNDTRSEVPLERTGMTTTYTLGSRSGIELFDFAINKPGIYELSASYPTSTSPGPEFVLAIFPSSFVGQLIGGVMGTVLTALAIILGFFVAGIAIIVVTFLKRRKTTRATF